MARVPAGGPGTINGVLYQMLWALNRVGSLQALDPVVDQGSGALTSVCLVLEPADGGDQQELRLGGRLVQQVKARSNLKAWSLQDIVTEVLPDLYKAVDLQLPSKEYQFVTESHPGRWQAVGDFFRSLRGRAYGTNLLDSLDDVSELRFARGDQPSKDPKKKPFWDGPYTERRLYEKITEVLRQRKEVSDEPIETTRAKLWHLLANFTFVGGRTLEGLQVAIDSWLRALIPATEDLPRYRDALLLDLARRATAGAARIVAADYLKELSLNAMPLCTWARLSDRASEELTAALRLRGFDPADDARPDFAKHVANRWTPTRPILILTGVSGGGQGKTWLGYSLLSRAAEQQEVAVLVEATGDASEDLAEAAAIFWQRIVGHDNPVPFVRIAARLQDASPGREVRPFCLLVDGVTAPAEARRLALEKWESLGMRIAITCPPEIAAVIRHATPQRHVELTVPDFSTGELQRYLEAFIGDGWPRIPADIRAVLRRPLLARLYRDLSERAAWQPTHEYELYARCWEDLFDRQGVHRQDVVPLYKLARSLFDRPNYPWTAEQAAAAGFDAPALDRLCRAGWLRLAAQGTYEVWHDRLLNWTVAQALVSDILGDRSQSARVFVRLNELLERRTVVAGRVLHYVPMDVVWLLLAAPPAAGLRELIGPAITALEAAASGRLLAILYTHLLPTVGPVIVPFLFERLEAVALQDSGFFADVIAEAIAQFDSAVVLPSAIRMLADDRPLVQRAAMRVLAERPAPAALGRLWELHCARHNDPDRYRRQHEHRAMVSRGSFDALRTCARMNPGWVETAIEQADATREPVSDLAYLTANLNDGGACWRRSKQILMAKVPANQERSIAAGILNHRDMEEIPWLRERIHRAAHLVGPTALRALVHLSPEVALGELDRLSEPDLYLSRDWNLRELLVRLPGETTTHLLARLAAHRDPWQLGKAFQGLELLLTAPILDILLDATASILAEDISNPRPRGTGPRAYFPLTCLVPLAHPELLDRFRRRRDLPLERLLTAWLLRRGPQQGEWLEPDQDRGLRVLAKIGGPGLTDVVNRWLEVGDRYGRMGALRFAARRADQSTVRILAALNRDTELWDGHAVIQGYAAEALAALGCWSEVVDYYVRWGWGTLCRVHEYRQEAGELDDQAMAPVLSFLASGQDPSPGVLLALGFGGRSDRLDLIRDTLAHADSASEVAGAATIALGWLKDDAPATLALLERQLANPARRHVATIALLEINTDAAVRVLLAHIRSEYTHSLALVLLNDSRTAAAVAPLIRGHVVETNPYSRLDAIAALLAGTRDDRMLDDVLADGAIREFLRDVAFGGLAVDAGGLLPAIRGLGRFDPWSAFLAAQAALQNGGAGREGCPYVLVELDPDRAVPLLLEHVVTEESTSVIWAIGRSLALTDHQARVTAELSAVDVRRRRAACRLASRLPSAEWLVQALRPSLNDPDVHVAVAARDALEAIHATQVAQELAYAVVTTADRSHQWVLLDGLLAVADPGDAAQPLPRWAVEIARHLPRCMRNHLAEAIPKRLKEMLELAQRKDR